MQDNFSKGLYPTLAERAEFMKEASTYVDNKIKTAQQQQEVSTKPLNVIISFSFVNTDLRVAFRDTFPNAQWILVDTNKQTAEERILTREGHFYKNAETSTKEENDTTNSNEKEDDTKVNDINDDDDLDYDDDDDDDNDKSNSEWEFQPVNFPHVILDGGDAVEKNAKQIVECIEDFHIIERIAQCLHPDYRTL